MTEHIESRRPTRTWGWKALSSAATATVAALIVTTAGVVVQIVAGVDFPTVPPVLFILLIPAVLVYVGHRWWWSAIPTRAGRPRSSPSGSSWSGESVRLFDMNLPGGVGLGGAAVSRPWPWPSRKSPEPSPRHRAIGEAEMPSS